MHEKGRENPKAEHRSGAYRFLNFHLYPSERQLHQSGKLVALQPKTFDVLMVLVRNAGSLVLRDHLVNEVWPDTFVTDANLTNIIVTLRKVLGKDAIQTVSKFGYRFTPDVLGEPGTDDSIYEMFVRAKDLTNVRSVESMIAARDLLWLCLTKDPSFATGWAWLGRCCRFLEKFKVDPSVNLDLARTAFQRALSLDPNLAAAHHFYTLFQADIGESREALVRLAGRLAERGDEPESWAGLVQVLRYCGLLDESIDAHKRATALDAGIATGVCHTHFLQGNYKAAIETYPAGIRYYLDAASWAALGDTQHARSLLQERLGMAGLSPLMSVLIGSLLSILEGRHSHAAALMNSADIKTEPEVVFYLARHFSLLGDAAHSLQMLRLARAKGFVSSFTVQKDNAFSACQQHPDYAAELRLMMDSEKAARSAMQRVSQRARAARANQASQR
jgi:DNA-binding winged helix-turn-helix (wHTH) protein